MHGVLQTIAGTRSRIMIAAVFAAISMISAAMRVIDTDRRGRASFEEFCNVQQKTIGTCARVLDAFERTERDYVKLRQEMFEQQRGLREFETAIEDRATEVIMLDKECGNLVDDLKGSVRFYIESVKAWEASERQMTADTSERPISFLERRETRRQTRQSARQLAQDRQQLTQAVAKLERAKRLHQDIETIPMRLAELRIKQERVKTMVAKHSASLKCRQEELENDRKELREFVKSVQATLE